VPGAQLAIGNAFGNYASLLNVKRDKEKAADFMKKDFESAAFRAKHKNDYLQFLSQSGNEADKATLKAELEKTLANANATEEEL
jgi:hypothetical protein